MGDVMLLRRLYLIKRHRLRAKRDDLMASTREQMLQLHPSENVARMADLADQLKQNASEDQQLLYYMSRAFYCGVSTEVLSLDRPCSARSLLVDASNVGAAFNAVIMNVY